MGPAPECPTHSWRPSQRNSLSAALRRCAITFHLWNKAPNGRTLRSSRMRRFGAAVAQAGRILPAVALVAGGKSFGGRSTAQGQDASALAGVRRLALLGFPLPPGGG